MPPSTSNAKATGPPDFKQVAQAARQLASQLIADKVPGWKWTFRLARCLMSFAGVTDAQRRQVAEVFHQQVCTLTPKHQGIMGLEAVVADLLRFASQRPRYAEGEGPLEMAVDCMKGVQFSFQRSTGPLYDKVATLAKLLAHFDSDRRPGHPILLPQKRLAQILGVSQPTVGSLIRLLVMHRVLRVSDDSWSYTHKKAKEYRFIANPDQYTATYTGDGGDGDGDGDG